MSHFERAVAQGALGIRAELNGALDDAFEVASERVYALDERHPSDDDSSSDADEYGVDDMFVEDDDDDANDAELHYSEALGARELLRQQVFVAFTERCRFKRRRFERASNGARRFDFGAWQRRHAEAHADSLEPGALALYGAHASRFVDELRARLDALVRESARLQRLGALERAFGGAPLRCAERVDAEHVALWHVDEERTYVVRLAAGDEAVFFALNRLANIERTARDFALVALPVLSMQLTSLAELLVADTKTVGHFIAELSASFDVLRGA